MKRTLTLCLLLFSPIYVAYCNTDASSIHTKRFVLGVDVGVAKISSLGRTVGFPLGYSTFHYFSDKEKAAAARYGISLSRKFMFDDTNNIIVGVSYHRFSDVQVNGTLQQGISAPLYTASYQYTLQLSQVLAEVKLQHEWHHLFFPYLTAGLGAGLNTAQNYGTTVPNYLTITPTYTNHQSSSLSYTLGLGLDTVIAPHVPNLTIGLGYLFSDLGQASLGHGSIRTRALPHYLNQSHVYINTFLGQLNWYF